jgi:hypothetical protein
VARRRSFPKCFGGHGAVRLRPPYARYYPRWRRCRRKRLPLPRGERVGMRGFGRFRIKLHRPNPLILSFSPVSAFTRVFDTLWGRRDAACRPRHSSPLMRTPSPQRGEGWGEGVRTLQIVLRVPNPLNLSFSPLGRRDAARRPTTIPRAARRESLQSDGATRMLHFFGRPLHMIAAHRVATRGQ